MLGQAAAKPGAPLLGLKHGKDGEERARLPALEPLLLPVLHKLSRKGARESIHNKFSVGLS